MPYVYSQEVWNEKAVNDTKVLDTEFERTKVTVIEITTAAFTGTIDIQGKLHEISAFSNVPHIRQDQASSQIPSVDQISHDRDSSVIRYVVLGYWRRLRLVMTRTAGTITCGVAGSSDANVFPYLPVEIVDANTLGYEFTINGVNFNGYGKIKMLTLDADAEDDDPKPLNFEDDPYMVPEGKVFIAFQALISMQQAEDIGRIGEADSSGGAISKEVLKLSNGTNTPFMTDCWGVFTAEKYITAETDSSIDTHQMQSGSVLYGIEVDA